MRTDREDRAAYMTLGEFDRLPDYSHTVPTGTTPGKRWKRRVPGRHGEPDRWLMGEFGAPDGETVPIHWHDVYIVTELEALEDE